MRVLYIAQAGETGAKQQARELRDHIDGLQFVSATTLDIPADQPYYREQNIIYPTKSLHGAVRALDPDLVHFHMLNGTVQEALPEIAAHYPTTMRAGLNLHESWLHDQPQYAATIPTTIGMLTAFDHLIAPSEHSKQDLEALGITADRITHIPSTIDFSRAREPDINAPNAVGSLSGRLSMLKNQVTLVAAIGALRELDPTLPIPCLLPGANQQRANALAEMGNRMGLGGLIQAGMWFDDPYEEFFPEIAVHLAPSFSERMPLTVLEAARAGVPTIAADTAWADQFEGLVTVNADDPQGWADAIYDLVTNDPRRVEIARRQQETLASEYDVEVIAPMYRGVWEDVVDRTTGFKAPNMYHSTPLRNTLTTEGAGNELIYPKPRQEEPRNGDLISPGPDTSGDGLTIALSWWGPQPTPGGRAQAIRGNAMGLFEAGHDVDLYWRRDINVLGTHADEYDLIIIPYFDVQLDTDTHVHLQVGGYDNPDAGADYFNEAFAAADSISLLDPRLALHFAEFTALDLEGCTIIPNAPNASVFEPMPRETQGRVLIPKIGGPYKNAEIANEIARGADDVMFEALVGADPPRLMPNIIKRPAVPLSSMPQRYEQADLVVNPSEREGLPNVAFESFMTERMFMATPDGIGLLQTLPRDRIEAAIGDFGTANAAWFVDEYRDEFNEGDHYVTASPGHLTDAIPEFLDDPDSRWATAERGRAWIEAFASEYDWTTKAERLVEVALGEEYR